MSDKKGFEKTVKQKETTVRYETWVNPDTGESREFAVVDKPYSTDYNFHKVWLEDLAKVLDILGGKKFTVFSLILKKISPYDNQVGFTVRELAEQSGSSTATVQDVVTKLVTANFMRKVRTATYKVNPKMLVKGSHNKRVGMMLKYDDLNEGRQLSIVDPAEDDF